MKILSYVISEKFPYNLSTVKIIPLEYFALLKCYVTIKSSIEIKSIRSMCVCVWAIRGNEMKRGVRYA